MRASLALASMLALTAGALRLPWPFVWIAAGWSLYFLVWALRARSRVGKLIALCAMAPILVLGAVEAALQLRSSAPSPTRFEGTSGNLDLWGAHEVFGYGPAANLEVAARRIVDGQVAYEFTYHYDERRQRIAPPLEAQPAAGAVVCLGCSFTLGEGVADELTYPYRIGELSGRRYEVRNFGYHGYGPHQGLAALQSGLVEGVCESAPALVLYLAIPDHLARIAGYKWWDPRGPWYQLEGGTLRRAGRFDERSLLELCSTAHLKLILRRSALARRYVYEPNGEDPEHTTLYEAIVRQMRAEVGQRFPGASFHVLAWEGSARWWESMARLGAAGVEVHRIDAMVPGLARGARLPTIADDPHPTPEVYEAIASFVVTTLLP